MGSCWDGRCGMVMSRFGTIGMIVVITAALVVSCTPGPTDPITQYGDISGVVRGNESGKVIEGAIVRLDDRQYRVSRSGIYVFKDVPEGYYELAAEKEGYHTYEALVKVTDNTVHNVFLAREIKYYDVRGYVYLENSTIPVPGVAVGLGEVWDTSDAGGYYELKHVLAATHQLLALKNHYVTREMRVTLESDTLLPIYIASARLTGRLEHRLFGAIGGATVRVAEASGISNSDGYYEVKTAPLGTHRVVVTHPEYDSAFASTTIRRGVNQLDIIMKRLICDTLPIEMDASLTSASFDGCSECPEWGSESDNFGYADELNLEYFLKTADGPPRQTFSARTRIILDLPTGTMGMTRNSLAAVSLVLYPTAEVRDSEYVSIRTTLSDHVSWDETDVTWDNAPQVSSLLYLVAQLKPGQPLVCDVKNVYIDRGLDGPTLFLQKEEIGRADPAQRVSFYSSEAADPALRPSVIVKYIY